MIDHLKKRKAYFMCLFLFIPLLVKAQNNGQIKGSVSDKNNKKGLQYATILLIAKDTLLGTKSLEDGSFIIEKIPFGSYQLKISSIGYTTYEIESFEVRKDEIRLGNIEMESGTRLKEVVIQTRKNDMDIKADKKVFHVDENITALGGMAEDVLKNVPGVSVENNGNVSLRGKSNVTLLINGKQSALFGDVATALESIPANNIESIEVITNPSAKYEAQGLGGIINIILKSNKNKKGFGGSAGIGFLYPFELNGNINLTYGLSDAIHLFLNISGEYSKKWEDNAYTRSSFQDSLTYESSGRKNRIPRNVFLSFGSEFRLNDKNTLTWTNSIMKRGYDGMDQTTTLSGVDFDHILIRQERYNPYRAYPSAYTTNLKHLLRFKNPGRSLNTEVNFSRRTYFRYSDYQTYNYDEANVLIDSFIQENPIRGGNWNGAFQMDYIHPLSEKTTLELGERSYFMNFHSQNFPMIQYMNEAKVEETRLKNDFDFLQQVHGVYSTLSSSYRQYAYQVGLRAENFTYSGNVFQYDSTFNTQYISLFPSAFVQRKLDEVSSVTLNYSRRVNRPDFFQLIPFIRINSPLDTSIGNPGLKPEFIHAFELSYQNNLRKIHPLLFSVYYQYTRDLIQRYRRFNPNGSTFAQNQNLANGSTFGLEISQQIVLNNQWDMHLNINAYRNIIRTGNEFQDQSFSGYGAFAKWINNTNLGKGFQFQLSSSYFAPKVITQGKQKAYGFIDLALKKSLLHKKLNISVLASDIFNTNREITIYNFYPDQLQEYYQKKLTRQFGLNIQYRFNDNGNSRRGSPKTKKEHNRDENFKGGEGEGE